MRLRRRALIRCVRCTRCACCVRAGKGPVVFSACSHAGIVNVARWAEAALGRPPYAIFGGAGCRAGPGPTPCCLPLRHAVGPPLCRVPRES
jgi:hypothetical protein